MKYLALIAAVVSLSGCAETELFDRNGHIIARFQGDMTNLEFTYGADGSISWRASLVSHSAATAASYTGAAAVTGAIGTAVAGALITHP